MEAYPVILPDASLQFALEPRNAISRTAMDSGRIRQQLRFTAEQKNPTVRWVFTEWEWAMFQSWFKYKISQGADFFLIDLPMGGNERLEEVAARFAGTPPYQVQHDESDGGKVIITAVLEVEEPPVLAEADFDAFITLGISLDSLEAAVEQLYNFVESSVQEHFPA